MKAVAILFELGSPDNNKVCLYLFSLHMAYVDVALELIGSYILISRIEIGKENSICI